MASHLCQANPAVARQCAVPRGEWQCQCGRYWWSLLSLTALIPHCTKRWSQAFGHWCILLSRCSPSRWFSSDWCRFIHTSYLSFFDTSTISSSKIWHQKRVNREKKLILQQNRVNRNTTDGDGGGRVVVVECDGGGVVVVVVVPPPPLYHHQSSDGK